MRERGQEPSPARENQKPQSLEDCQDSGWQETDGDLDRSGRLQPHLLLLRPINRNLKPFLRLWRKFKLHLLPIHLPEIEGSDANQPYSLKDQQKADSPYRSGACLIRVHRNL